MKFLLLYCLTLLSNFALAHGMSPEDQARILNAGPIEYMRLGATHMLSGYDHLLFLFGVMFFLTRFKDILTLITAFTIGHSITLVFATLATIQANYYLIDAVIALTVCYKAFENLDGFKKYLEVNSPNLTGMVFAFGLIHGFGLSTRLQQLPLGEEGLVTKILAFNLGVELGQIIALTVILILLNSLRRTDSFPKFSRAANALLMILGFLLLLMQLHGYQHTQYPDDFPLNADDHHHIHENMTKEESALAKYPKRLNLNEDSSGESDNESDMHTHDGENFHIH